MVSFNLDFSSEKCTLVCNNFGIDSRNRNIFKLNGLEPNNLGFDINNGITLITGHSGVGKSTLGEIIKERYGFFDIKDIVINDVNLPIIDLIDADFKNSIYFLNIAGLSEPYLYLTSYENLSLGQKFRFLMALMISKGIKKFIVMNFVAI